MDLPGYVVDDVGLKKEVTTWKQILCDEILVGPHSHTVTHTEGAQHVQDLEETGREIILVLLCHKIIDIIWFKAFISAMELSEWLCMSTMCSVTFK